MPNNTPNIEDLRTHLFATLQALRSDDKPMDLDRAKAVADVARVIIESAKVEVQLLAITGGDSGSGFFPTEERPRLSAAPQRAGRTMELSQRPLAAAK
jgi:hypothetical protein